MTTSAVSREEFAKLLNAATQAAMDFNRADHFDHDEALAALHAAKDAVCAAYDALVEERDTWAAQCDEMGRALRDRPCP